MARQSIPVSTNQCPVSAPWEQPRYFKTKVGIFCWRDMNFRRGRMPTLHEETYFTNWRNINSKIGGKLFNWLVDRWNVMDKSHDKRICEMLARKMPCDIKQWIFHYFSVGVQCPREHICIAFVSWRHVTKFSFIAITNDKTNVTPPQPKKFKLQNNEITFCWHCT